MYRSRTNYIRLNNLNDTKYTRVKLSYLYRSDHLFVVVVLLILLSLQYLLIVAVRDKIITVATHTLILGKIVT